MSVLDNIREEELLKKFKPADQAETVKDLSELDEEEVLRLKRTGVDLDAKNRLGTFLQTNCGVVSCECDVQGVEMLPITEALKKYDGLA